MIIIFVLAGLLLLGGGIATIIDGLPYLVLERGFTQVIVGTVLATAGLLLLALSRVLVELKRVRATLSNAMMAVSMASMAGEAATAPTASAAPFALPGAERTGLTPMTTGLAVGAGAAVLAAGAAVAAATPANDEPAREANASADKGDSDPAAMADLFGPTQANDDEPGRETGSPEASWEDETDQAEESERVLVQDDLAWPDEAMDDVDELAEPVRQPAPENGDDPFSEDALVASAADAEAEAEAPAADKTVESEPAEAAVAPQGRTEPWLNWSRPEPKAPTEPAVDEPRPGDEFGFLRESLAGRAAEREDAPEEPTKRDDPRVDTLRHAESWMDAPLVRVEPWFETHQTPAEPESSTGTSREAEHAPPEAPAALQPPPWPPQTREHVAASPADEDAQTEPHPGASEEPAQTVDPTVVLPAFTDVAGPAPAPEPVTEEPVPPVAEPVPPAASEEGIVGAYQVGDAHFTIFADGSIKARTPDGDYRFASMDELKTYLASEKSRLGV